MGLAQELEESAQERLAQTVLERTLRYLQGTRRARRAPGDSVLLGGRRLDSTGDIIAAKASGQLLTQSLENGNLKDG